MSIVLESDHRGTFGSISVARLAFMKDLVALKRIAMEFSDILDIMAEIRTLHALAGHPLFPHCFGYILPNVIVIQLLGRYENGVLAVETVDKLKIVDEAKKVNQKPQPGLQQRPGKPKSPEISDENSDELLTNLFGGNR